MEVSVIGLGRMGLPMARHLLKAGFTVRGYDIMPAALAEAGAVGVTIAGAVQDLAPADAHLVIVPSDEDVTQVCLGSGKLAEIAKQGSVIALCASIRPETAQAIAEAAGKRGVGVIDAALTRGERAAEAGTLAILCGGAPEHVAMLKPVFAAFAPIVHHLGKLGAGQVAKTANNLMLWGNLAVAAEALRLGQSLGVPAQAMRAALFDCSADSWVLRELERVKPTWPAKDMENALRMADAAGEAMPVARTVAAIIGAIDRPALDRLLNDKEKPQ